MSWIISKEFKFEAAHKLPFHDGACRRLHGHSYKFRLFIRGISLHKDGPKTGMVMDFKDVGDAGKVIVEMLDHQYLNDILDFETTAEKMSKWIYERIKKTIPDLWAVEMNETETSLVRYCPFEGTLPRRKRK